MSELTVIVIVLALAAIINALIRSYDQRKWRETSERLAKQYQSMTEQLIIIAKLLSESEDERKE